MRSKGGFAKLMRVPIQLGSLHTQALLDTGAQVSIMAVSVFSKVPKEQVTMIKSPEQCIETITTVSGERLRCIGHYEMPFTLYNQKQCRNVFLIIPRLDEGIILGVDFITKFDIIIQPGKRLLSFGAEDSSPLPDDDTAETSDTTTTFPIFQVSVTLEEDNYDRFNLQHLAPSDRKLVGGVLAKYPNVFKQKTIELGMGTTVKHAINIIGPPVYQPLRRLANSFRPIVKAAIDEMLEAKVIRESSSPFASPVVIVPKPKSPGEWRFCIDYRRVNNLTIKDMHPLPRIDATLDALHGARFFTTLDLLCGYWQIEIEEQHKYITAFICEFGQYEWNRMSFGLCNAPATFQRFMNSIFRKLLYKSVLIYLDDVIIFSKTLEEHIKHIEEVLEILEEHRLKLKLSKCFFAQLELEFLGFIINALGVRPDPKKIEAVRNYPEPRNQKELLSLLGLANYYRRFVRGYAEIAHPLTELTRKNIEWVWGDQQRNAFDRIKTVLTSRPLLSYPDFSREFTIQTDASGFGLGAVLSQMQCLPDSDEEVEVVIAYASRHLTDGERKWSTTEKECLAIIYAITVFKPYIYGREFTCVTDHRPLEWLMSKKDPTGKLERWAIKLQEYQMKIGYRSGKTNQNADSLSRTPMVACYNFGVGDWVEDQAQDEYCQSIISSLDHNENPSYIFLPNGLLAKKDGRIVVPARKRHTVLELNHDHKLSGHLGVSKTLARIKKLYTWPQMANDVVLHIRNCIMCAKRKTRGHPKAPLQSLPVYDMIWETLAMDIVGPLPETREGFKYILVISDYATRYVITRPMKNQTASTVAKIFVEDVLLEYGSPLRVITDQGRNFVSNLVSDICKLFEIDQLRTTAYHPQTDGLVERFNKTMVDMLTTYVVSKPDTWNTYLPYVTAAYNTSKHSSLRYSPFYLLRGWEGNMATGILTPSQSQLRILRDSGDMAVTMHREWRSALAFAHENLANAKAIQKWYYDTDSLLQTFDVGDKVLLQEAVTKGKFHMKWAGPFVVLDKISDLTYRIQNETNKKISIVHVNRLVPWKVQTTIESPPAPEVETMKTRNAATTVPQELTDSEEVLDEVAPTRRQRGRPRKAIVEKSRDETVPKRKADHSLSDRSNHNAVHLNRTVTKRKTDHSLTDRSNRKTVRFADTPAERTTEPNPPGIQPNSRYNLRARRNK